MTWYTKVGLRPPKPRRRYPILVLSAKQVAELDRTWVLTFPSGLLPAL